ncbi:XK1 [Symbiodinium sp. CCMP2592]|nr:XK1 [Symbiodinium sp. CCMP2592]
MGVCSGQPVEHRRSTRPHEEHFPMWVMKVSHVLRMTGSPLSYQELQAAGYGKLAELGAGDVCRVVTAGGGAKNSKWRQIRQRLIGVQVQSADWTEAACGSALLALRGSGLLG